MYLFLATLSLHGQQSALFVFITLLPPSVTSNEWKGEKVKSLYLREVYLSGSLKEKLSVSFAKWNA
jgi:hypothetical protein